MTTYYPASMEFNGETYLLDHVGSDKQKDISRANRHHSHGSKARVITYSHPYTGEPMHLVYVHYKETT